jgi:hypothetical protein
MLPAKNLSIFEKKNQYEAKVLMKIVPRSYDVSTLLMRCIDEDNVQTIFTLSGEAKQVCDDLEENRIYLFQIPGKCVRKYKNELKSGVCCELEVVAKVPFPVALSKKVWQPEVQYKLKSFIELAQCEVGDWVDVTGIVANKGRVDDSGGLLKKMLTLTSGELEIPVELLGAEKMQIPIEEGDTLAGMGFHVAEYNGCRYLVSAFLTYIEVNPSANDTLTSPEQSDPNSPKKKALKATESMPLPLTGAIDMRQTLLCAPQAVAEAGQRFATVVKIRPLTEAIFESAGFLYGNDDYPKIKLVAELFDDRASLSGVTVWDDAVRTILETDASTVVNAWQNCGTEDGKAAFLQMLNLHLDRTFRLECQAKLWCFGKGNVSKTVQYHVNSASVFLEAEDAD